MWNNKINEAIAAIAINIFILDFIITECTLITNDRFIQ